MVVWVGLNRDTAMMRSRKVTRKLNKYYIVHTRCIVLSHLSQYFGKNKWYEPG